MDLFQQKFAPPDTGEWYSTNIFSFRPKIACKRNFENPPIEFTAEQAARHVAGRYGQPTCTLLEALLPTTRVKPYFDYELYLDKETDTEQIYQWKVLPPIMRSLHVEPEDVRMASRHGWIKTKDGRKFKVSFRAFVQGKWLHVAEMNTIINAGDFEDPGWDKGVYPTRGERIMAVVGGVKAKDGDFRVLEPMKEGYSYHEYLIQALDGNEEAMDVQPPKGALKMPKKDVHSVDAALGHVAQKPSWLTLMDDSMLELASDYMYAAEMKFFKLGKVARNTVAILNDPGERNLSRICVHKDENSNGVLRERHRSNNASVLFYKDRRVVYKCFSSECINKEPYLLGVWSTMLPSCVEEMEDADLMKLNTDLAKLLLNANRQHLAVEYMNRCVA